MKISRQILWLLILFHSLVIGGYTYAQETTSNVNIAPLSTASEDESIDVTSNTSDDERTETNTQYRLIELVEAHLEEYAKDYAEKGYRSEIEIGNIDPYHAIKDCSEMPDLSINRPPLKQNRVTTEVRCSGDKPWKLYISAEFNLYANAVIASSNIRRGQVLTEYDLDLKEVAINKSHYTLYHSLSDVVGMVAKRSLRADSTILPSQLVPPKLVKRGDNVVIVAKNSAISVRMTGKALSDGALGQQIPVQNLQSKRVVKARVSKAGLVTILL